MKIASKIIIKIKTLFEQKYIPIPSNPYFSGSGHHEYPLFAKILRAIGHFIVIEWKWLLGFMIALIALYINLFLKR